MTHSDWMLIVAAALIVFFVGVALKRSTERIIDHMEISKDLLREVRALAIKRDGDWRSCVEWLDRLNGQTIEIKAQQGQLLRMFEKKFD